MYIAYNEKYNKMKSYFNILLLLIFCTFISCTDTDDEAKRVKPPIGAKGYFSAAFSMAGYADLGVKTRGTPHPGKMEENMVRSIRLVFYGTESNDVVKRVMDLDATNMTSNSDIGIFWGNDVYENYSSETFFVSTPLELTVGEYDLLVIFNPTSSINRMTAEGQPKSLLESEYLKIAKATTNTPELTGTNVNRFVMTNVKGLYRITQDHFYISPPLFQEIKDLFELPLIFVERAVAKVAVTTGELPPTRQSPSTRVPTYYTFSVIGWNVDIVNKNSFLMRHMTNKAGGEMESPEIDLDALWKAIESGNEEEIREVYKSIYGDLYGIDPNYDKSLSAAYGGSNIDRSNHFNYSTDNDLNKKVVNMDDPNNWSSSGYVYIPENTMEADGQHQDVTTRVVLKVRFGYFQPSIKYNKIVVTEGDAINFLVSKCYGKNDDEMQQLIDNGTIEEKFRHFNQVADYLVNEKNHNFQNNDLSVQYSDETKSLRYQSAECDFSLYGGGITYYSIPIRHFSDSQEPSMMGYGRYGVLRNNLYLIYIKNVYSQGEISFPEPSPAPDDVETQLDFDFLIFNWYEHPDFEYNFGEPEPTK